MPVTSAPSDRASVWHDDGVTALRRRPVLVADGDRFTLEEQGRVDGPFPFAALVRRGAAGGVHEYGLADRAGWRIGIAEPIPTAILVKLPVDRRDGGVVRRLGCLWAALVLAGVIALLMLALSYTPNVAAKLVPVRVEQRLGDLMVGTIGARTCNGPAGDAALQALTARLGPAAGAARIRVVDLPAVNAVALPGGHVLIFDGLLQRAASPDEVAGVLAHELGHVAGRDVLAALFRQLGLSVVLGGVDGNVAGYTSALLSAGYSRATEARADDYAVEALRMATVSPLPTAEFFLRLGRAEAGAGTSARVLGYLSSHPVTADREQRFRSSADAAIRYRPTLDAAQWQALRRICRDAPHVGRPPSESLP